MLLGGAKMRASNGIRKGFAIALCFAGGLSAYASSGESMMAERIATQETRLGEIEASAAQETEQVEQWYTQRCAERTRTISRREAARIGYADRLRWVEFMKMHRGQSHPDAYFDASSYGFVISPSVHRLRLAMEQEYLLTEMADLLVSDDFFEKLTQIVEERWDTPLPTLRSEGRLVPSLLPLLSKERWDASLLPLLREEARRLLDVVVPVRRELTAELRHLENARRARLDATMEWERDLKEQVHGILEYLRQSESRQAQVGVVESIGYCPQSGYFCMVEGVDRVLGMGDTIGGIRVLSINREKVEFAKNGTTWAQQLGAPPEPHWQ